MTLTKAEIRERRKGIMERVWKLDGEVVSFKEIIKCAQECGYESDSGIYQTSIACQFLKKAGYQVECVEDGTVHKV